MWKLDKIVIFALKQRQTSDCSVGQLQVDINGNIYKTNTGVVYTNMLTIED